MRRFLAIAMTFTLIFLCFSPARKTKAVVDIAVYLSCDRESVNQGDILELKVIAERMPHITSFKDIDVSYDKVQLEYMSSIVSPDLPETFTVATKNDNNIGVVSIDGSDETVENYINEHKSTSEDGDDEEDEYEDISFDSDSPVILCTLKFRVKSATYEKASFIIASEVTFTNSNDETVNGYMNDYFTIPITSDVSGDATLDGIKINGTLLPSFKRDLFEYTYTVDKNTSVIEIECSPGNLYSEYEVSNTDLTFGENIIYIDVTAQDGYTSNQYKIVVNRPTEVTPGTASFIDCFGNPYSFVSIPENIMIPNGFRATTTTVNGYEVPCYVSEGVSQIIIYVMDSEGQSGLMVYNAKTNRLYPYDVKTTIIKKSTVYTVKKVPKDIKLPDDFIEVKFWIDGREYEAFANPSGEVICYLETESGTTGFYKYDFDSQTFGEYEIGKQKTDAIYKTLFGLCLGVAIFEAIAIIVIVYVIRRFRKERVNPRPRRV